LVPASDPFTRHEFLLALETSGSVGPGTGWQPCHVLAHEGSRLVAAVPLYFKSHSYGEYIFDWAWASAAERAGLSYYPKLVSAVPFTPVTGRRLLTGTQPLEGALLDTLCAALEQTASELGASSYHLLFLTPEEHALLEDRSRLIGRITHQYHWKNNGYQSFEDWLGHFRSRRRKEVLRERARAAELGTTVSVLRGEELTPRHWEAIERYYLSTVAKKHAYAYLERSFFERLQQELKHLVMAFVAENEHEVVATSLCFQQGQSLFGRYWGCQPKYRGLHFELCYHLPIQTCIENSWHQFEAGAQGRHKIQRGLMPSPTYSVHRIGHTGLAHAVEQAIEQENIMETLDMKTLSQRGPFRRCQT